jgi:hypothetical protein
VGDKPFGGIYIKYVPAETVVILIVPAGTVDTEVVYKFRLKVISVHYDILVVW